MNVKMLIDIFQKETDGWRQMLVGIIRENINLKIRLAGILADRTDQKEYIEMAEAYQNRFIQNDVIIGMIRKDIAEFQKSLSAIANDDDSMLKGIIDRKAKLQREILSLHVAINDLKNHFNVNIEGMSY